MVKIQGPVAEISMPKPSTLFWCNRVLEPRDPKTVQQTYPAVFKALFCCPAWKSAVHRGKVQGVDVKKTPVLYSFLEPVLG